ncbi:MAG: T9SS type A sorting domain-containing protein [Flavobacteriales bacterium]|nr:T9SS type A sorting domain-containing protein [Flavobacteriales bacterium]
MNAARKLVLGLLLSPSLTMGQSIVAAEYFVDADPGVGNAIAFSLAPGDSTTTALNVPLGALPLGMHRIGVRHRDADGHWSHALARPVYVHSVSFANPPAAPITSAEYFVDTDPGVGNGAAFALSPGDSTTTAFTIDASALTPGFHRICARHKDADGQWSHILSQSLYIFSAGFTNPPTAAIAAAEYFIDSDPGVGNGIAFAVIPGDSTTTNLVVDVSALLPGMHRVCVRQKDATGKWGLAFTRSLYIFNPGFENPANAPITGGEYYFDTDPGVGNGTAFAVTPGDSTITNAVVDVSALTPGFHLIGLRHKDANGRWGHALTRSIFIVNPAFTNPATGPITAGEYFVDTDPGVGNGNAFPVVQGDSTTTATVIDLSALSAGFHRIGVRHKDITGKWGLAAHQSVYVFPSFFANAANAPLVAGEYFFDTDPGNGNASGFTVTSADSVVHALTSIDLTGFSLGFHYFCARFRDANGKWGQAQARPAFIYPDPAGALELVVGEYYFDSDPGQGAGIAFATGAPADSIDVNVVLATGALPPGQHRVGLRVRDSGARWSHSETRPFEVEDGGSAYRTINSGDWSDPAIWERHNGVSWVAAGSPPSHVSGTITVRSTHTVNVNAATTMDEVLVESGGAIVVASTATVMDGVGFDVDVLGSLTITTGGLLTGTGTVRIVHQFFWTGGETGAGITLSIASSGTATMNCACTLVHGGVIQNAGTWTVLNGNLHGTGSFSNLASGVISIQGAQDINNAWAVALTNAGSVQVNVATYYTFTTSIFVNQGGSVSVLTGDIWVNGFTNTGSIACASSSVVRIVGGSFINNAGGSVSGGAIVVAGGNLVVNAALNILHLYVLNGTVSGAGGVYVLGGGTLTCTGGSISAGCAIDIAVTATVNFNAPTVFYNYGSINLGGIWNHVSGSLHGNGSVTVLSTAVVNITGVWDPYDSWQNALVCHGAINVNVPIAFAFTGQVDVEVSGVVTVVNGVLWTYGFNNGGTLVCLGSSVLRISGGVFVHEVGGSTSTAGIILAGGTLIAQAPLDILHLWLEGGLLQGPQPINVITGGTFTWTGGTIHASCVLNLAVGVVSVFNTTVSVYCYGVIYNGGTWSFNGGNLVGSGAFHNLATAVFTINGVLDIDLSWELVFYNAGIVNKSTALVFTHYGGAFHNLAGGVVNVLVGEYRFKGGYYNYGIIATTGPALLCGCGGTFYNENGGEASNGRVVIRNASLVVNWALDVKHFELEDGAQVFGPLEVKVIDGGTFKWIGGTIEASAIIDIAINVVTTFNPVASVFCHGVIHHRGTWNFNGGDLKGDGTFHNYLGAIVYIYGVLDFDLSWRLLVYNAGEFRKMNGGIFTHYATYFHNLAGGLVHIIDGEYRFKGGFYNYGNITYAGLGKLCGCGGTFYNENGGEASNGRVVIRDASLVVNWDFDVKDFELEDGAQVFGPFMVKVINGGTFKWIGGTIEASAIIDIAINVITTFNPTVSVFCHGVIHHRGTWNFEGGKLWGNGLFNNLSAGLIMITGTSDPADSWRIALNNAGIYRMNCGCLFRHQSGAFTNLVGGKIEVLQGTLVLDGVFIGDQFGEIHVSLGAVLDLTAAVDWKGEAVICHGLLQCPDFRFKASVAQVMGGDGTYTNVRIDNAAGIDLQGNVRVSMTARLGNGVIRHGLYGFSLENPTAGALIGGSALSYFVCDGIGRFRRAINGANCFYPVGTASKFCPITLSMMSGPQDVCGVRVRPTVNTSYGAIGVETGTTVSNNVVGCTWVLDEATPGSNTFDAIVEWEGSHELSGFTRPNCTVAYYTIGGWATGIYGPASGTDPYTRIIIGLSNPREICVADPSADLGGDAVDCLGAIGGSALPGTPCDDNDNGTTADTWTANCDCEGTPIPTCTTDLDFVYQADGNDDLTWQIFEQGTNTLMQSGGGALIGNGSEATCLPDGCYYLVVTDGGGDGIVNGGYLLKINSSVRLIDNLYGTFGEGGFTSGGTSQIAANEGFCLPVGTDRLIYTSCDKRDWKVSPCGGEFVVANANQDVSDEYGVNNANSGYQMWWYTPNGGYSFKRFQSHNTSNGLPASATRAAHFQLNAWLGNQLTEGGFYNVKVRGRINGNYNSWGPACRLVVNSAEAQCPRTKLMDLPGNQYLSCGQSRAIGASIYVHAKPVRRMNNNCNWVNANRYQFRFRILSENITIVKTSATGQYWVNTNGLACNKTYEVDVRASFNNGSTWCHSSDPYGDVCQLTTTCSFGMAEESSSTTANEARVAMYPNPNNGDQVRLSLSSVEEGVESINVDIYDAFGKRVAQRTIRVQDGVVNTTIALNGELANGMYLVSIAAGSAIHTERLVIQK